MTYFVRSRFLNPATCDIIYLSSRSATIALSTSPASGDEFGQRLVVAARASHSHSKFGPVSHSLPSEATALSVSYHSARARGAPAQLGCSRPGISVCLSAWLWLAARLIARELIAYAACSGVALGAKAESFSVRFLLGSRSVR